jgi:RepB DNA-primase from phage plasmid
MISRPVMEHVRLVHALAAGCDGKIVVASYGQTPGGLALPSRIEHAVVGDIDTTVRAIDQMQADAHRNVYMPLAVFRRDLEPGRKGSESDVAAVLGLMTDFDARSDPHAGDWCRRMPVPADYALETSPGSFQAAVLFAKPVQPMVAKALGTALVETCRSDTGTKDISHVWRIPGLLNWPDRKKIGGRLHLPGSSITFT